MSTTMKNILSKADQADLTPEEEAALVSALSAAYHQDEQSSSSRNVQRIAEKVQAKMMENEEVKNQEVKK